MLTATYFSVLGCFHTWSATFLGKYPTAQGSPTHWGPQGNPDFTFTASHSVLSRPPCRDTSDTCPASVAFNNHRERFYSPFLVSLTLEPEPCSQSCHILLLAGAGTWPPLKIAFSSAFYFDGLLHCLSFSLILFS